MSVDFEKQPAFNTLGTNGLVRYRVKSGTDTESEIERDSRSRFWRSLGKKVRKGSRIASAPQRARHARSV